MTTRVLLTRNRSPFINILRKLFGNVITPTFDLYAKAAESKKPDGIRKTAKELYEDDPVFPLHSDYV